MGKGDTKARSKGEARRAKRGRPRKDGTREPSGKLLRIGPAKASAVRDACAARARAAGWDLPTDDAGLVRLSTDQMRTLMQPWMGSRAGRYVAQEPDVTDLWSVIRSILDAEEAYLRAIDAPRLPVARHGDAPPPDQEAFPPRVLTAEEAALTGVRNWRAVLRAMEDSGFPALIKVGVLEDRPCDGFADALRAFADVVGLGKRASRA